MRLHWTGDEIWMFEIIAIISSWSWLHILVMHVESKLVGTFLVKSSATTAVPELRFSTCQCTCAITHSWRWDGITNDGITNEVLVERLYRTSSGKFCSFVMHSSSLSMALVAGTISLNHRQVPRSCHWSFTIYTVIAWTPRSLWFMKHSESPVLWNIWIRFEIGNFILPTDWLIFFRGVYRQPVVWSIHTVYNICICMCTCTYIYICIYIYVHNIYMYMHMYIYVYTFYILIYLLLLTIIYVYNYMCIYIYICTYSI